MTFFSKPVAYTPEGLPVHGSRRRGPSGDTLYTIAGRRFDAVALPQSVRLQIVKQVFKTLAGDV